MSNQRALNTKASRRLKVCKVMMRVQETSELFETHVLYSKPHLRAIQYMHQTDTPLKAKSCIILIASFLFTSLVREGFLPYSYGHG